MFNIGMGELFLIIILALVVVGPERLPQIMRQIGKYVYDIRMIVNELTDQFADELRPLQEMQQLSDDLNPIKQVTKIAIDLDPRQPSSSPKTTITRPETSANAATTPPLVKPTDAFKAASPAALNPMKIIGQNLQAPEAPEPTTPPDASDTTA